MVSGSKSIKTGAFLAACLLLMFIIGTEPAMGLPPTVVSSNVWGKLIVKTDPPNATISFLRIKYVYKEGIILRKGKYIVKVAYPGYEPMLKEINLKPGVDNVVEVKLQSIGSVPYDAIKNQDTLPQPEPKRDTLDKRVALEDIGTRESKTQRRKTASRSEFKSNSMMLRPWGGKSEKSEEKEAPAQPEKKSVKEPVVQPQPESTHYKGQIGGDQGYTSPPAEEPQEQDLQFQLSSPGDQGTQPPTAKPVDGPPPSPMELVQVGLHLTKAGDLENAIKAFSLALQQEPENQVALRGRAFAYYHSNQLVLAADDLNVLLNKYPEDPLGYFHRGNVYLLAGDYDAALDDYNRALELEQSLADLYNARGTAYYNLGRYDEAVMDFDQALNIDNGYVDAYYNRGSAFLKMEKHQLAIDDFDKALELRPDDAQANKKRKQARKALRRY